MKKRVRLTKSRNEILIRDTVEQAVNRAFTEGFKSVLLDITYRVDSLMNMGLMQAGLPHRITSEMLHLPRPILDGFTFSDNFPVSGYVSWSDCNIMYKGTKYTISNGNSNQKYIYWTLATTPTTFKLSATKPTLTDDDILICINNGGVHQLVIGDGRMVNGAAVLDGSISSGELGSGAVTTSKLASGAVDSTILASSAVTTAKIAFGAVDAAALASSAVTTTKLAANAVDSTKISSGAVGTSQLAASAVTDAKIASGAITTGKIASGAVNSDAIAAGAISSGNIATGAIGSSQIADGAVIGAKIGAGQIAAEKLSIATHMLF